MNELRTRLERLEMLVASSDTCRRYVGFVADGTQPSNSDVRKGFEDVVRSVQARRRRQAKASRA